MTPEERERLCRNALVAFVRVIAVAVVAIDESEPGKLSVDEFLETVDQTLEQRVKIADGAELEQPLHTLRDMLEMFLRRTKGHFDMRRAVDDAFDEIVPGFDW